MNTTTIPTGYTITRRVDPDDGYVTYWVTAPNGSRAHTVYRREAVAAAQAHHRTEGRTWWPHLVAKVTGER